MDETIIFGNLIKDLRAERSISQEKLSQISGLDRTFISLIENGKRNPTLTTILKLSNAFDLKISDLLSEFELRYNKNLKQVVECD